MAGSRALRKYKDSNKKQAPVLSPKQLKRLLYVAGDTRNPERNRLIVWLLFAAGFRISEVAQIEIKDVLWKSGKIRDKVVIPAKYCKSNKAGHVFFYHTKLIAALEAYLAHRLERKHLVSGLADYQGLKPDSKLILSEHKRPYALKRKRRTKSDGTEVDHWACDTLQDMVTKWGREAGIAGFTTHSGRRTFATRLSGKGATEEFLCAVLRHSTDDMPYEYIDPDFLAIKRSLRQIYGFEGGNSAA